VLVMGLQSVPGSREEGQRQGKVEEALGGKTRAEMEEW
jgi:hypothetical protein